jgi:hypothetical protein
VTIDGVWIDDRICLTLCYSTWLHACLRSRYFVMAAVYLLISQSLSSNRSTCHDTLTERRDSLATDYGLDDLSLIPGRSKGFFSTPQRPYRIWGPSILVHPTGTKGSVPGVKRQGREADHSPPSSVKVKNVGAIHPLPPYVFMIWCLIK